MKGFIRQHVSADTEPAPQTISVTLNSFGTYPVPTSIARLSGAEWYGAQMAFEPWKRWQVWLAAVIGGAVVLFSAISAIVNGLESVRDVFAWAIWAYDRANTPWLGVFMLLLVGGLLWWGIKEMRNDAKIGNETNRTAWERETAVRAQALEDVRQEFVRDFEHLGMLRRAVPLALEAQQLRKAIAQARERRRPDFATMRNHNLATVGDWITGAMEYSVGGFERLPLGRPPTIPAAGDGVPTLDRTNATVRPLVEGQEWIYDRDKSGSFESAVGAWWNRFEQAVSDLEQEVEQKEARVRELLLSVQDG
jgi:hypothetical protein